MISHQYRCIFVHIPKTAGSSIEYKLGHFSKQEHGVQDHRSIQMMRRDYWLEASKTALRGNLKPAAKYVRDFATGQEFVNAEQFDAYFKFTFVRNPWARVYSWYKNVMRDAVHQRSLGVAPDCTFKMFVTAHLDQWALQPQLSWITNEKGEIPLDFIGKYESIAEDFAHVCQVLGIEDGSLPKLIAGDGSSYVQQYDEEMCQLVGRRYADEIAMFSYRFGQ